MKWRSCAKWKLRWTYQQVQVTGEQVLKEMPDYVAQFIRQGKVKEDTEIIVMPDKEKVKAKHIKQNNVHAAC